MEYSVLVQQRINHQAWVIKSEPEEELDLVE